MTRVKPVFYATGGQAVRPQQWLLAFGLALVLEALLLLALGWKAALLSSPLAPEAEAGDGDDMSMALLAASGEPLRTARFLSLPAPLPAPAAPTPAAQPATPQAVQPVIPSPVNRLVAVVPAASTEVASAATAPAEIAASSGEPTVAAVAGGGETGGAAVTTAPAAGVSGGTGQTTGGATGGLSGSGSGVGSRHARHPYFGKLKAWLNAHKTYPAALKKAKTQGTVLLTFTISRSGELLSARIVTGSGEPGLDQAALDMLQRSSPMPPLPDDLGLDKLTLTIPVEYSLITR